MSDAHSRRAQQVRSEQLRYGSDRENAALVSRSTLTGNTLGQSNSCSCGREPSAPDASEPTCGLVTARADPCLLSCPGLHHGWGPYVQGGRREPQLSTGHVTPSRGQHGLALGGVRLRNCGSRNGRGEAVMRGGRTRRERHVEEVEEEGARSGCH